MDDKVDVILRVLSANRQTFRNYTNHVRIMSQNRGNETATHMGRAINFYGSHIYVTDDFIAHSWSKTERSYLPSSGLCGCIFFFFFFNCYSSRCRDIILSPACVRRDILRTETVALLLFFSFFRIITIGELERWQVFYAINREPFDYSATSESACERASYLFGRV